MVDITVPGYLVNLPFGQRHTQNASTLPQVPCLAT
jgi:hypothetical protein